MNLVDNLNQKEHKKSDFTGGCEALWSECLALIRLKVPSQTFNTWFQPIKVLSVTPDAIYLQVPNKFFYDWLESHYRDTIQWSLREITGNGYQVKYTVLLSDEQKPTFELAAATPEKAPTGNVTRSQSGIFERGTKINESYSFENFVEGAGNQFARAAAIAVADAPGRTSFNPLVIYGGTGLGKTHLLQAIGNRLLESKPQARVVYVSSDTFTLDFIAAIQKNRTTQFSKYYRSVDMLLLDDIQFFQNKEQTQEQFFHIFNDLYQHRKQIVLTTDHPPMELRGLQERLLSRFHSSLTVDIQPPDLETRIAILQKKAQQDQLDLPFEVIEFIAENVRSNIRELEGFLIRLLAYSSLLQKDVDLSLARRVMREKRGIPARASVSIEDVQNIVSRRYRINLDSLVGKVRTKEIANARMVAMYIAREHTNLSLKTIGIYFGGRDHSTVVHACKCIEDKLTQDAGFARQVEAIIGEVTGA